MFFKNLCIYRIHETLDLDHDRLESALAGRGFEPCGRMEPERTGWAPPLGGDSEELTYAAGSRFMLCQQEETRLLPASVVRETLDQRVAEIEAREGHPIRKKEKTRMRDEIYYDLLPRAFTRNKRTYGYLDVKDNWLIIDANSWKQAEEFSELLRDCLGSLPITPVATKDSPQSIMSAWLAQQRLPEDFDLGDEAVLEDPQKEGCEVRVKRQFLMADEMLGHISSGKRVKRLSVTWDERMSCVIDADMSIKRLKFLDIVQEALGDREPESNAERFDADFSILTLELARFIPRFLEIFGGEDARG